MAQPAPHRGPGGADATSKAGAGPGTLAGPAGLRPTAGRQAPVSRQQPGKGKRGKSRNLPHGKKQKKPEVDILSPAAMLNLYYIAHNVADCLRMRGFRWPGAPKTKRGKNKT
ncbi:small lysine-rich protein 1 [Pteropus medius]|uniref:small lysine-rich protein 1 n=1 Tax=Pteropus vampyrus TaxID=132908 RepID=UPI00196BA147|nr:small lysine-rich protein 1 [Pteropus giganteus]